MNWKLAAILLACCLSQTAQAEPIAIDGRRELFVDDYLIDSLEGAELFLHQPHDEGIVFRFDRPWEGLFCGYCTIIHTDDKYQLYYRGIPTSGSDGRDSEVTCYAESKDGVHWERPAINQYVVHGIKENNVILANAAPVTHNFSPFLDTNPKVDPKQRYKAIGGTSTSNLVAYVSPDGIHWSKLQAEPVIKDKGWVFDSQNVAFWSESEQCYVAYYRRASEKVRAIARTTSKDFIHWDEPVQMTYDNTGSGTPRNHLYTNQTHPYFRAPQIYVATAARFMPGRRVITPEQAAEIGVHPQYFNDSADAILMTSRGGSEYDCTFDQGFVRPGTALGNWVSRTNYPVLNVVQTGPEEMSLYVNQEYGQPTSNIHRYSLRLDGFASVRARREVGTLVTKPLMFAGDQLELNFATSAAGGVRVEIQDEQGKPISGYSLNDSNVTIGNDVARIVSWKGKGSDLGGLAGKPIRLKFEIDDADLFAFRFVPK
ncbi:hypothetical protein LOC68_22475 [Blastopirellula sp. JC732]|uniref:Glycosyl hydrolase family 32 N-terminal domain-containing protein n=1 Tax=Blastopirellula sediminis TaxID=2894196 RepID=A0A9X1SI46_9BACT|nr:hypothetical protein [Blastopirellula sediminis]MCC9605532.1 hypothetical protein [Blastopirellula sediminis]MCC9631168.1 hypothetical protein [Blastopirellula sediminis]